MVHVGFICTFMSSITVILLFGEQIDVTMGCNLGVTTEMMQMEQVCFFVGWRVVFLFVMFR